MRKRMSVPCAIQSLRSPDRDLRGRSLLFLRDRGGERAVAALVSALESPDAGLRSDAAYILGIRGEGYELLIRHLRNDPSASVRNSCAMVLSYDWFPPSIEVFIEALGDQDIEVVRTACVVLARSGDRQAVLALRQLLQHKSWPVRFEACWALLRLGAVEEEVVATAEDLDQQPEAKQHNERLRINRHADLEGGFTPASGTYTTMELVQAVKEALATP